MGQALCRGERIAPSLLLLRKCVHASRVDCEGREETLCFMTLCAQGSTGLNMVFVSSRFNYLYLYVCV